MKYNRSNTFKRSVIIFTSLSFILLAFFGCRESGESLGVGSEPDAAIGFSIRNLSVTEGVNSSFSFRASKPVFNDISFEIKIDESDQEQATKFSFRDKDGNTGPRFTLKKGEKLADIEIITENPDVIWSDSYTFNYTLTELVGERVYLTDVLLDRGESFPDDKVYHEFNLTLVDDFERNTISMENATGSFNEEDTNPYQFKIQFSKETEIASSLNFDISGDAVFGEHFSLSNGNIASDKKSMSIDFEAGITELTIDITPTDNQIVADDKNLIFTLKNGVDAAFTEGFVVNADALTHDISIVNDDTYIVITMEEAEGVLNEDDTEDYEFKILFSEPASIASTLNLDISGDAVVGSNFTISNGTLAQDNKSMSIDFAIGTTELTVVVSPDNSKTDVEEYKNVVFTLKDVSDDMDFDTFQILSSTIHTILVKDDDIPATTHAPFEPIDDAQTIGDPGTAYAVNPYGDTSTNSNNAFLCASNDAATGTNSSESFLKFDLATKGIDPATILSAKIVLTVNKSWSALESALGGVPTTQYMYLVTDDTWSNTTLTGDNEPASETIAGTSYTATELVGNTTGLKHEYDVTDMIKLDTDGLFSVRLALDPSVDTGANLDNRVFYGSSRTYHARNRPIIEIITRD